MAPTFSSFDSFLLCLKYCCYSSLLVFVRVDPHKTGEGIRNLMVTQSPYPSNDAISNIRLKMAIEIRANAL